MPRDGPRRFLGGLPIEMLSIGKLVAGYARYYLDQAAGRVDVVDSIGEGIEDYYIAGPEARGEWIGLAGRDLGLGGPVDATGLRRLLAGLDPREGQALREGSGTARVAAFDRTHSLRRA